VRPPVIAAAMSLAESVMSAMSSFFFHNYLEPALELVESVAD
jgi:hypothetical protein